MRVCVLRPLLLIERRRYIEVDIDINTNSAVTYIVNMVQVSAKRVCTWLRRRGAWSIAPGWSVCVCMLLLLKAF